MLYKHFRKGILTALGLNIFICFSAHAQFLLGIKGGLNINKVSVTDTRNISYTTTEPAYGMHLGAVADIGINRFLSIKTELLYTEKGYKVRRYFDESHFENKDIMYSDNWQLTTRYLELPVLVKFFEEGKRLKFFANAGFYAAYWFGGNFSGSYFVNDLGGEYYKRKTISETYTFDTQYGSDHSIDNRFDFGGIVGAGLAYKVKKGEFFVEGRYNMGFIDLKKYNTAPPAYYQGQFNRNWSVSTGFLLTIKPQKKKQARKSDEEEEETGPEDEQ